MLKKSMAAVVMVMVFALALAGCGGSDGVMSKGYGDLFRDKAAINKAVTEIKAKGGGTPLMIFQSMHFGPEFINFSRQDPKNKENVDNFVWTPNTGWQGPKIVNSKIIYSILTTSTGMRYLFLLLKQRNWQKKTVSKRLHWAAAL